MWKNDGSVGKEVGTGNEHVTPSNSLLPVAWRYSRIQADGFIGS